MQALVFGPLGTTHTTADLYTTVPLGLGDVHRLWSGNLEITRRCFAPTSHRPVHRSTPATSAARSTWSSAAGCSDGRRILTRQAFAALTTGGPSTGVGDARYAMGLGGRDPQRPTTISHDGSTTDMSAFPGRGTDVRRRRDPPRGCQAIPYEVFGKIDMIGWGALDQMLGHEPDGTLERLYPIVDVFLNRARRGDAPRSPAADRPSPSPRGSGPVTGGPRRLATIAFHGYLDVIVPILLLVRVPDAMAAPWPVLVRTDVGLVVLVLVAVRLTGGGLRLVGWWRSGRTAVWSPAARGFSGDVRPVG